MPPPGRVPMDAAVAFFTSMASSRAVLPVRRRAAVQSRPQNRRGAAREAGAGEGGAGALHGLPLPTVASWTSSSVSYVYKQSAFVFSNGVRLCVYTCRVRKYTIFCHVEVAHCLVCVSSLFSMLQGMQSRRVGTARLVTTIEARPRHHDHITSRSPADYHAVPRLRASCQLPTACTTISMVAL